MSLSKRVTRTLVLAAMLAALFSPVFLPQDSGSQLGATQGVEIAGVIGPNNDGGGG